VAGREPLNRGDIRWYRFASPNKRRPVLILGQETVLRSSSDIPVIPLSTQVRGLPWEVLLGPEEGFQIPSVLKPEWIRSVPHDEIGPWICSFPAQRWTEVRTAVLAVLGLNTSPEK
jgi:mRNA interferase MazF